MLVFGFAVFNAYLQMLFWLCLWFAFRVSCLFELLLFVNLCDFVVVRLCCDCW